MARHRVQVLEIGSRTLRALAGYRREDGALVVEDGWSTRVDLEGLAFAEAARALGPVMRVLARRVFSRRRPVHVVGSETLVRSTVRALEGIPGSALADLALRSHAHVVQAAGTRRRTCGITVILRRTERDGMVDLVLLHAWIARPDLRRLDELLAGADLTLGGVISPVQALWGAIRDPGPPPSPAPGEGPTLVVHAGHSFTTLLGLEGDIPGLHAVAFTGGADLEAILPDSRGVAPGDPDGLIRWLQLAGHEDPGPGEPPATGDPVRERLEAGVRALARDARDRLVSRRASPPRAGTGSPGDGPAPLPPPDAAGPAPGTAGGVAVTGGLALAPLVVSTLQETLGAPCRPFTPAARLVLARRARPVVDPAPFAPCLGALGLLTGPRPETINVAHDFMDAVRDRSRHEPALHRIDPAAGRLAAGLALAIFLALLAYRQHLAGRVASLTERIGAEEAARPDASDTRALLMAYRGARWEELSREARLTGLEHLLRRPRRYRGLFNALADASPADGFAIGRVRVRGRWPRAAPGPAGLDPGGHDLEIHGEAERLETVTTFVQGLSALDLFASCRIDETRLVPGSEDSLPTGRRLYTFRVSGEVRF